MDKITPRLFIRIEFENGGAFGPGKARLLELIDEHGSIRRAAILMKMSYPHAWKLIDAAEKALGAALISTMTGGANGGGAALTAFGRLAVQRYRAIERRVNGITDEQLHALSAMATPPEAGKLVPSLDRSGTG